MRAKLKRATLEIFVPYPDALLKMVQAEAEAVRAFTVNRPHCVFGPWLDLFEPVDAFMETLDVAAVRAEMSRKAKKLEVRFRTDCFPVEMSAEKTGVVLSAKAFA